MCECVRACSHREFDFDGMACKSPSVKAFMRINRMLRLCACDSNKDRMAVPGFAFRPRRIRGVADLPVRLPSVFLFEPLAIPGLEIDIPAVFLFESSLLAVSGLDIGTRRIRGVTDVPVCLPAVFMFKSSFFGRSITDVPVVCGCL